MKIIKTKLLQKAEGGKIGKYILTLEVTDYDIEMFEDLNSTDAPYERELEEFLRKHNKFYLLTFNKEYGVWIKKVWHCFWKLWNTYDKYKITGKEEKMSYSKLMENGVEVYPCFNCFKIHLTEKEARGCSEENKEKIDEFLYIRKSKGEKETLYDKKRYVLENGIGYCYKEKNVEYHLRNFIDWKLRNPNATDDEIKEKAKEEFGVLARKKIDATDFPK